MMEDEAVTVDGQPELVLNSYSSTMTQTNGTQLKLGKVNCFNIKAVNKLGPGKPSHSCIESKGTRKWNSYNIIIIMCYNICIPTYSP